MNVSTANIIECLTTEDTINSHQLTLKSICIPNYYKYYNHIDDCAAYSISILSIV